MGLPLEPESIMIGARRNHKAGAVFATKDCLFERDYPLTLVPRAISVMALRLYRIKWHKWCLLSGLRALPHGPSGASQPGPETRDLQRGNARLGALWLELSESHRGSRFFEVRGSSCMGNSHSCSSVVKSSTPRRSESILFNHTASVEQGA